MNQVTFKGLFKSEDSRYTLRTALLITAASALVLLVIIYSIWLLVVFNHSYFIANGFPNDSQSLENFFYFILLAQIDYLPYVGIFFITVFFIGIFMAYVVLRPFNHVVQMCESLIDPSAKKVRVSGLNKQKVLVKIGNYLCDYYDAKSKNKENVVLPKSLEIIDGPAMDKVFYFQFICLMLILVGVTVFSINVFTGLLYESITTTALSTLKSPKGLNVFLSSQQNAIDLIVWVPSVLSCILYFALARVIISKIEGVTYAYVRDIREVGKGNSLKRISARSDDPGRQAAEAINRILDKLHQESAKK